MTITIKQEFIKLDSFLKYAGAVDTGGIAKVVIHAGGVTVNGSVCIERGKKIRNGDVVEMNGKTYVCKQAVF